MSDNPSSSNKEKESRNTYGTDTRPNTAASMSLTDPFSTPLSSRPPSIRSFTGRRSILNQSGFGTSAFSSSMINTSRLSPALHANASSTGIAQKSKAPRMRSHMLTEGTTIEKSWASKKNPRATFSYWIVYALIFCGIAGGVTQCFFTWKNVALDKQPLCMVLDENFDNEATVFGENGSFFREVNMDGFGNGQFDMATASQNNSFIKDGKLYIVPTLTSDNIGMDAVLDGTVYNITDCTFNLTHSDNGYIWQKGQHVFDEAGYNRACSAVSNSTSGSVINPVQSARLTTKKSASIRFGRVEVRAKMPHGDWLWPAIWMLPKDSAYGAWPLSGEIDIVESRGNGLRYTAHGSNFVQGALNWGPALGLNGVMKTYSWWTEKRKSFASDFHTYALEWTPEFLRIYVDSRLHTLLDLRFDRPFFDRGDFPDTYNNGSGIAPLANPWINGTNASPFDQEFYLILNVAVGGTSGWFPEAQGDKPWLDRAQNPARDFIKNIAQWYPTWPSDVDGRSMVIDYVKMWKHC